MRCTSLAGEHFLGAAELTIMWHCPPESGISLPTLCTWLPPAPQMLLWSTMMSQKKIPEHLRRSKENCFESALKKSDCCEEMRGCQWVSAKWNTLSVWTEAPLLSRVLFSPKSNALTWASELQFGESLCPCVTRCFCRCNLHPCTYKWSVCVWRGYMSPFFPCRGAWCPAMVPGLRPLD